MATDQVGEFDQVIVGSGGDTRFRVAMGMWGSDTFRSEPFRPVIVFGPQRSGKTTGIVIPAVLEWEGPCLVTSVRFDVAEQTLDRRRELGDVYIFDPTGLAEKSPKLRSYCFGWSPLDGIDNWDSAVRRANGLSEGLSMGDVTSGVFWQVSARQLLAPLLFAAAQCPGSSMVDVLDWLGTGIRRIREVLFDRVHNTLGIDLEDRYGRSFAGDEEIGSDWLRFKATVQRVEHLHENTYNGITATATAMLEVFTYSAIQQRCDAGGIRLLDLLNGGSNTLYVCAPPSEQRLFMPLFTALVREVLTIVNSHNVVHVGTNKSLDFLLCLDEAGNIAKLEDLDTIATTAAGSGIQLISVFHDMSQLSYSYTPPRARLIANNHSGMIFLPGNRDPETNGFLTEVLREEDVRHLSHLGWTFADLRRLEESRQLCIYRGLNPIIINARRSYVDPTLVRLSENAGTTVPEQRRGSRNAETSRLNGTPDDGGGA
ncbi:hypothetical protein Aca07nite_37710 [Actinoplanes capillaceus]|uniref:Type IV secretion system protein VirD4 n=1 Tax=Actinoplanes campanulatus TaxID=113559 RepID=A0ABQ3WJT6_9ACTN|nr:type IV secretory system conjugative DNA transfer family protein [Actinoplanes capillaceus]GID46496.1 hypothetical protein Aca07nite_37710 [Actinoplanes capillaceus]